mgnify:CR=1 FL=1
MNYLAHIYLSKENDFIKIGNFIADGVKGKSYLNFPKEIQVGILLHRQIDTFTDRHPIVKLSKKRLFHKYRHYSSVIVDIYYDHFLAKNWKFCSPVDLSVYAKDFYNLLTTKYDLLPRRYQNLLPFMASQNWLLSYASLEGIHKVLEGMNRRAQHESKMDEALFELKKYNSLFENEFKAFFNELIIFSELKTTEIKNLLEL